MKNLSEKTKNILLYVFCCFVITASVAAVILVYSSDKSKKTDSAKEAAAGGTYGYSSDYVLDPTSNIPFEFWDGIVDSEDATTVVELSELPEEKELTLDLIYQKPELPSGCESVALTMLLNYYGFNLDKTTIADNYLIFSDENFVMGFMGNPHNTSGGGAYAPSMVNTANRFLIEQESDLRAINISGTDFDDLFAFVAGGTPVMVWTTIGLSTPNPSGTVYPYGDTDYQWVSREHCVVLSGYNLSTNEITIYDSLDGIMTYNKDDFAAVYDGMWKMAMILQ
jgi:uncharacterized protein YvpB